MSNNSFHAVTFPNDKNSKPPKRSFNSGFFVVVLIALAFIGIIIYQGYVMILGIRNNWEELKFAYDKPAIIKAIRQDYEKKTAEVDKSYMQSKQTAQDQLIQAVTDQLKPSPTPVSK